MPEKKPGLCLRAERAPELRKPRTGASVPAPPCPSLVGAEPWSGLSSACQGCRPWRSCAVDSCGQTQGILKTGGHSSVHTWQCCTWLRLIGTGGVPGHRTLWLWFIQCPPTPRSKLTETPGSRT